MKASSRNFSIAIASTTASSTEDKILPRTNAEDADKSIRLKTELPQVNTERHGLKTIHVIQIRVPSVHQWLFLYLIRGLRVNPRLTASLFDRSQGVC